LTYRILAAAKPTYDGFLGGMSRPQKTCPNGSSFPVMWWQPKPQTGERFRRIGLWLCSNTILEVLSLLLYSYLSYSIHIYS
jgi:hypothetical protein